MPPMKNIKHCFATLALCAGCWFAGPAQDISYATATIPPPVRKNADVIKRYEQIQFEVTDIDRANMKVHQVFTVLNVNGKDALLFHEYSTKFRLLGDVEIKVYDTTGKQLTRYKKKDLTTVPHGEGLVDDGKVTFLNIPTSSYPITVEFEYEQRFKGTLHYPRYDILEPGQSVERSVFIAKVPKDLDLRYKERNIKLPPQVTEDGKYKTYQWAVNNLPSVEYEEGAVSYESRYPAIVLAPNHFKMDDYDGDMTSWKNFGRWYASLKKGNDVLTENKKAFMRQLVKDNKDDREKTKIIYDYLQKNFRYVNISLGIGGYKPFPADFTDNNKYGDCKALSNFMQAALDAVGVKAHQALINSQYNSEPVDPAFPCSEFNHVILCVPQKKDSIWLECTSKTVDFGVLGSSTENRNALLITDDGGVLVPTPLSKSGDNLFQATTVIHLNEDATGSTSTLFYTKGLYKEIMTDILNEKKDDQKESVVYGLGFKQPDVFEMSQPRDSGANTRLNMDLEKIPEFVAGNKMFISPRMYKLWRKTLPKAENRKLDFYFRYPFEQVDTTILQLPAGFVPEALPKPKSLECAYGSYTTSYWYDESKKAVCSSARLVLNRHKIPVAGYAAVKKFFDDVMLDEAQRIVIKKQ